MILSMDTKSKILLGVLLLAIFGSVGATYYRYIIKKDYIVESKIDCDPTVSACFVWQCDPASKVEGEACVNDPAVDTSYYALARRNARKVPLCDPEKDTNCKPWECGAGEQECGQTFCDATTKVEQGVECNDPVQYNATHPVATSTERTQ